MIDFAWKIFSETGNLETYLLMKEIERDNQETADIDLSKLTEVESPLS